MLFQSRWITPLALAAIIALGILPLFPPSHFLFLDDGNGHLFRFAEFDWMLRAGEVYPRWAPDLAYGYGYPVFNFYAPLTYYLAEIFRVMGADIPTALQLTLALFVIIGTTGAYEMGRALFANTESPRLAGMIVALAYVFFPYFLLDIFLRGALAEALAAAILPWLIWSLHRVIHRRTSGAMIVAAFVVAAMVLAHNLTVVLSAPFLGVFVLWELFRVPKPKRVRAFVSLAVAILCGGVLAAFYWLPAVTEMSLVAVSRANKPLVALLDGSFLSVSQVVQFTLPYQYTDQPYPLGIVSLIPVALALILGWRRRATTWLFGALVIIAGILLLDVTREFWKAMPLLKTVQFAWRVSVLIGLGVAVTTGGLIAMIRHTALRVALAIACAAILVWNGLGNLAPQRLDYPREELTRGQMARVETNTRGLGFGSFGEFLPRTVQSLVTRLDSTRTGATPTITLEEFGATRFTFRVATSEALTITLRVFHFAGWQATDDGQPTATFPNTPLGLVAINVPAGEHRVVIFFGDTLPRQIGALASGIAACALVGAMVIAARRRGDDWRIAMMTGVFALVVALPSTFVAFTAPAQTMQTNPTQVARELRLIGWRAERVNDTLQINAIWHVQQPARDDPFTWRLVGDDNRVWSQRAQHSRYNTGFPEAWIADEIVADYFDVPLAPGMPAGKYQVQVSFGANASFTRVGEIELTRAVDTSPEPTFSRRADALVGNRIRLLGANMPARVNAGEALPVTLFWRAERDVFEDYTVFAQLLDADGNVLAQRDSIPQDGFLPTMLWMPGRVIDDSRLLKIPRDATPGVYRFIAGMYRFETLERLPAGSEERVDLGEVIVPVNASSKPRVALNATLGNTIRLEGFDAEPRVRAGKSFALTLHWQAIAPPQKDVHVFVHVLDAQGNLVAQQDNTPRQNRYPTRIWDAGERVPDSYAFTLNTPGAYRIVAGMYDPPTGERLPAFDAQGNELVNRQIVVTTFEVTSQ
ncbi:MAG: hypothetical protein HY868_11850 [Chloroflexi bacterium]|nr:hypothetical protein [Chloroflexota bacterium]